VFIIGHCSLPCSAATDSICYGGTSAASTSIACTVIFASPLVMITGGALAARE
jgi:hypothetical protein